MEAIALSVKDIREREDAVKCETKLYKSDCIAHSFRVSFPKPAGYEPFFAFFSTLMELGLHDHMLYLALPFKTWCEPLVRKGKAVKH